MLLASQIECTSVFEIFPLFLAYYRIQKVNSDSRSTDTNTNGTSIHEEIKIRKEIMGDLLRKYHGFRDSLPDKDVYTALTYAIICSNQGIYDCRDIIPDLFKELQARESKAGKENLASLVNLMMVAGENDITKDLICRKVRQEPTALLEFIKLNALVAGQIRPEDKIQIFNSLFNHIIQFGCVDILGNILENFNSSDPQLCRGLVGLAYDHVTDIVKPIDQVAIVKVLFKYAGPNESQLKVLTNREDCSHTLKEFLRSSCKAERTTWSNLVAFTEQSPGSYLF
jgi:hypothetical protein